MQGLHYYIIFGAAVRPDGTPSGSLTRRVEGAWALAGGSENARFLVTGGQGAFGPPEARVMQRLLLALGATPDQILLEERAVDTMQSAFYCAHILREQAGNHPAVTVCSSPYHNFRCQMLLSMLGIRCDRGAMPSDRPALGTTKWLYYYLREMAAIPWDCLHMCFLLFRRTRTTRGYDDE